MRQEGPWAAITKEEELILVSILQLSTFLIKRISSTCSNTNNPSSKKIVKQRKSGSRMHAKNQSTKEKRKLTIPPLLRQRHRHARVPLPPIREREFTRIHPLDQPRAGSFGGTRRGAAAAVDLAGVVFRDGDFDASVDSWGGLVRFPFPYFALWVTSSLGVE